MYLHGGLNKNKTQKWPTKSLQFLNPGVLGDGGFGDKGGGFGGIFYILIGITKIGILHQKLICY